MPPWHEIEFRVKQDGGIIEVMNRTVISTEQVEAAYLISGKTGERYNISASIKAIGESRLWPQGYQENECIEAFRRIYPKARFEPPFRHIILYFDFYMRGASLQDEVILFLSEGMFVGFVHVISLDLRDRTTIEITEGACYLFRHC